MDSPNPNHQAEQRQLADQSWLAHDRFAQREGYQSQPARPMRPLGGKLELQKQVGNDFFYRVTPSAFEHPN